MNITNHAAVRELALFVANQRRERILSKFECGPKPFERVSAAFHDALDAEVHALVVRRASEHWQKGVTLT